MNPALCVRWKLADKSVLYELSTEPFSSLVAETLLGEQRNAMEVRGAETILANPGRTFVGTFFREEPRSVLALLYHAGHAKDAENGWQIYWTKYRHTQAERFIRSFPELLETLSDR